MAINAIVINIRHCPIVVVNIPKRLTIQLIVWQILLRVLLFVIGGG